MLGGAGRRGREARCPLPGDPRGVRAAWSGEKGGGEGDPTAAEESSPRAIVCGLKVMSLYVPTDFAEVTGTSQGPSWLPGHN